MLAGQLASSSLRIYAHDMRAYLAYAGTPAAALDPATLARWRTHLTSASTLSPHTINRMLSVVKRLVREASAQGYVAQALAEAFDDIAGVKVAALKTRTKQDAPTRIEPTAMRRLCDAPDPTTLRGSRDRALLATLASSGLQVSQLASLTSAQILDRGTGYLLRVRGKHDTDYREAPLSQEAYRRITIWLDRRPLPSAYLFTSFAGRGQRATAAPLSGVAIWRIVQSYARLVGLNRITPQDFRRFVGTQLAVRDIRQAQQVLGHTCIGTTTRHTILDALEPGLTDDLY
jgi:integrase